ncbi:MAG: hypothetical protein FJ225_05130 [Lentisphaerae bacterium]|nr:hypothetical protein [Lentisphaerota bacterium]
MKTFRFVHASACACAALAALAPAGRADWTAEQRGKWVQPPVETSLGLDVGAFNSGMAVIMADDFRCTQWGPITNIHVWGSWKGNQKPDPTKLTFQVSFWSDNPNGAGQGVSAPENIVWPPPALNPWYPPVAVRSNRFFRVLQKK